LIEPIWHRVDEATARPQLLNTTATFVDTARAMVAGWATSHPQVRRSLLPVAAELLYCRYGRPSQEPRTGCGGQRRGFAPASAPHIPLPPRVAMGGCPILARVHWGWCGRVRRVAVRDHGGMWSGGTTGVVDRAGRVRVRALVPEMTYREGPGTPPLTCRRFWVPLRTPACDATAWQRGARPQPHHTTHDP